MAKNETMYTRVEEDSASAFDERAALNGHTRSEALRELIYAYSERRVTIVPRDQELYHLQEPKQ